MSTDTALVPQEKSPVAFGARGIELRSLEDAWRMATAIVKSGLAPKGINSPEAALVAIQSGMELGMTCMQSLQNLTVINGKIGITGDAALALVRCSGLVESWEESYQGEGDALAHVIVSRRRGEPKPYRTEFTVADARTAQLWGKSGPWTQYARRMLRYRNLGFHLRDFYPEPLKGFKTSEELADYPVAAEKNVTPIRALPEAEGEVVATRKNAITSEQCDTIIRLARDAGVVPDTVSMARFGMPVLELSTGAAQAMIGHLKTLPAGALVEEVPAADAPTADDAMPFDAEPPADLVKEKQAEERKEAEGHQIAALGGVTYDEKARRYVVQGKSETVKYKVTKTPDGRVACTCPDFKFNGEGQPGFSCKHLHAVRAFAKSQQLPLDRISERDAETLRAAFQQRGIPPAEWLIAHNILSGLVEECTADVFELAMTEIFN